MYLKEAQNAMPRNKSYMAQLPQAVMKTPVRKQSAGHTTTPGAKDARNSHRQSGIKPFSRVDTNMVQSSSRKSIKQVSSATKKG